MKRSAAGGDGDDLSVLGELCELLELTMSATGTATPVSTSSKTSFTVDVVSLRKADALQGEQDTGEFAP